MNTINPEKDSIQQMLHLSQQWMARLAHAQSGHYAVSERSTRVNEWVAISIVLLSAFVSCTIFIDSYGTTIPGLKFWGGIAAIMTSILAGYQGFKRPAEKAELHRVEAARYGALRRAVELQVASGFEDRAEARAFFREVKKEWDDIANDAPVTPQAIRKRIRSVLDQDHKDYQQLTQGTAQADGTHHRPGPQGPGQPSGSAGSAAGGTGSAPNP